MQQFMNPFGFRIVTEPSTGLRSVARQALQGKWGNVFGGAILYVILTTVPIFILNYVIPVDAFLIDIPESEYKYNVLVDIYNVIIMGPMTLGFTRFILNLFRQKPATPLDVLNGFEQFLKSLGLYIVMGIFVFLWSLLLIVPGIIAVYRYGMAFNILADNPDIKILDAIRLSSRMMFGNKMKLFCLQLSFIGWFIFGAFTMGVGMIYVQPYYASANIAMYEMICGRLEIQHVPPIAPPPGGPTL